MGKIWIPGGGGGADVSVVTADASDVIKNKIIVGPDGEPLTGTMPNNGAVAPDALNAGGSYTVPAGYHNGSGKVTAKALSTIASEGSLGWAQAHEVMSGATFSSNNGIAITGTMPYNGSVSANITPSASAQSYTIPWGCHSGAGKVNVAAIPSNYVDISGGLTFFDSGTFGAMVTNLGLGKKRPHNWSNGVDGWYDVTTWYGDESAIDPSSLIHSTDTNYFRVTKDNSQWCTRKTINFDNIKSINIAYGSSYQNIVAWFYNVDRKKLKYVVFNSMSSSSVKTLDISGVTGNCVFGIMNSESAASVSAKKIWFS